MIVEDKSYIFAQYKTKQQMKRTMQNYKNLSKCLMVILGLTIAFFIGNLMIDAIFNDSIEWKTSLFKAIIAVCIIYILKYFEKVFQRK